jgi:hypothetical protein
VYLGADGEGLTGDPKNPSPSNIWKEQPNGLASFDIAPAKEELWDIMFDLPIEKLEYFSTVIS